MLGRPFGGLLSAAKLLRCARYISLVRLETHDFAVHDMIVQHHMKSSRLLYAMWSNVALYDVP